MVCVSKSSNNSVLFLLLFDQISIFLYNFINCSLYLIPLSHILLGSEDQSVQDVDISLLTGDIVGLKLLGTVKGREFLKNKADQAVGMFRLSVSFLPTSSSDHSIDHSVFCKLKDFWFLHVAMLIEY